MGDFMKNARVLVTTECNLHCAYCCNKLPEIQRSIRFTTIDQFIDFAEHLYENVNISGGEPMMDQWKTLKVLKGLKKNGNVKVFLYTNGLRVPTYDVYSAFAELDGVNIGVHGDFEDLRSSIITWKAILGMRHEKPETMVRVHIQDVKVTPQAEEFCRLHGVTIVAWKMNDCNKTPEDRYIV
jgi:molybdenum cofactor biosynthesis enzyme MoaA